MRHSVFWIRVLFKDATWTGGEQCGGLSQEIPLHYRLAIQPIFAKKRAYAKVGAAKNIRLFQGGAA